MNKQNTTLKKAMLIALEKNLGIVSQAAIDAGINRNTHYNWLKEDEEYKREVEDLDNAVIDFAESKLHEKIKGIKISKGDDIYDVPPSDTAIIFFLKTKGKKRGYIERNEVEVVNAQPITGFIVNETNLPLAPEENDDERFATN